MTGADNPDSVWKPGPAFQRLKEHSIAFELTFTEDNPSRRMRSFKCPECDVLMVFETKEVKEKKYHFLVCPKTCLYYRRVEDGKDEGKWTGPFRTWGPEY